MRTKGLLRKAVFGLATAALLLVAGCAQPTAPTTAPITENFSIRGSASGYVVGPDGLPVSGIRVGYTNGGRAVVETRTGANGLYEITNLASGTYDLLIGGDNGYTLVKINSAVTVESLADVKAAAELAANAPVANTTPQYKQYVIDEFGNYNVNYNLGETQVYPLTATITGIAQLTQVDQDENLSTAVVTEGNLLGVRVAYPDSSLIDGIFTTRVGAAGAFTLTGLPASAPLKLTYNFFLVSSDTNTATATAFKIDDSGWHVVDNATGSNTEGFEGFEAQLFPSTVDSHPVNVGNVTFKASIAPTITAFTPITANAAGEKFAPGVAATPTALTFTFSKAMNTAKGVLKVWDGVDEYTVTKVWDATNTILTVTPSIPFELGVTIDAVFTGFVSTDGVVQATKTIQFFVEDALKVSTTSWSSPLAYADLKKVAVTADVTITFNKALTTIKSAKLFETATSKVVDAVITFTGAVITVNPAQSLKQNIEYAVDFVVTDDITELAPATKTYKFTTVTGTTLAASTIAFDGSEKLRQTAGLFARTGYNGNEAPIYMTYTKLPDIDGTAVAYAVEYRKSTDDFWTAGTGAAWTLNAGDTNGDTVYATLTNVTWVSGDTWLFRIRASHTGATANSLSNELTLSDTVGPTQATIAGVAWNAQSSAGVTTGIVVNVAPTANTDGYFTFTIVLAGSEAIGVPTIANGTLTAADAVLDKVTVNGATATVRYRIPKTAATTYGGRTLILTLRDNAGNLVADYDVTTAGTQGTFTLTL